MYNRRESRKMQNSDGRSLKMYKNTILMIVVKGLSLLMTLVSAPIMLHHVDRVDYGVLLTITSIISWVGYMDIGLGNGLRNKLPELLVKKDFRAIKTLISSSYAVLALYVLLLIVIFLCVNPFIDWTSFLNAPSSDPNAIGNLVLVVFVAFCLQFLFGLVNSILYAFQLPAYTSFFTFLGQLIALIALVLQIFVFDVTSVLQIGVVNCIIPPIVLLIGSIILFKTRFSEFAPTIHCVKLSSVGSVMYTGFKFFILQIISIVLFQANSIIIAKVISPEIVVEYNLAFKYLSILTMLFGIIITPVWSATTDAYVQHDYDWIKKTLKSSLKICALTIIVGFIMVAISKQVYHIWLGKDVIEISYTTTFLIFVYIAFELLYKVYGTIINGIGKLFAQMLITGIIAIGYIPLAIFLGRICGLSGILIANVIVFFLNYIWSRTQCKKLINQTATGIWNK